MELLGTIITGLGVIIGAIFSYFGIRAAQQTKRDRIAFERSKNDADYKAKIEKQEDDRAEQFFNRYEHQLANLQKRFDLTDAKNEALRTERETQRSEIANLRFELTNLKTDMNWAQETHTRELARVNYKHSRDYKALKSFLTIQVRKLMEDIVTIIDNGIGADANPTEIKPKIMSLLPPLEVAITTFEIEENIVQQINSGQQGLEDQNDNEEPKPTTTGDNAGSSLNSKKQK